MTSSSGSSQQPLTLRRQIEAVLVVASALSATVGFGSVFLSWSFIATAAVGVAVAVTIVLIVVRCRYPLPVSLAASLVAYLVVGTLLIEVGFGPDALVEFVRSSVNGWSTLLTTAAPLPVEGAAAAVPFAVAWFGALVGAELALRTDRTILPLLGPLGSLALTVLFGIDDTDVVRWSAGGFLVLALVFLALRSQLSWFGPSVSTGKPSPGRALSALALVAVSALIAPIVAPHLPFSDARQRFTLREEVDVDFDLRQLSSPLSALKGSLTEERADDVMFNIAGPPTDRVRFAVLDAYDGSVWRIARSQNGNEFVRTGSVLPDVDAQEEDVEARSHTVTIEDLDGFWLPSAGVPATLVFNTASTDIIGRDPAELVRFDDQSGSLLLAAELRRGLTYRIESYPVRRPSDAELASLDVWQGGRRLTALPDSVAQLSAVAERITRGRDSAFGKAAALEAFFAEQYYEADSPTGHTARHLVDLFSSDELLAFDERYAAGFAVLARLVGLPTRVVVGYRLPTGMSETSAVSVTAGDIEAWVEVAFEEVGWVPFDAGPDETRSLNSSGGTDRRQDSSAAPPPPPQRREPIPQTTMPPDNDAADDDETINNDQPSSLSLPVVIGASVVLVPLLLFGLFAIFVLGIKRVRRKRRQRADSTAGKVEGAWQEVLDRSADAGIGLPAGLTVREAAARVAAERPATAAPVGALTDLVERTAFHPSEPSETVAAETWSLADSTVAGIEVEESLRDRLGRSLSTKSLRR